MSCQQRSGRVAAEAAVKTGIGTVTSKMGTVIGTVIRQTNERVEAVVNAGQVVGKSMLTGAQQAGGAVVNRWAATQDALDERLVGRLAPVSNAVLRAVDRPAVVTARAIPYVIGALATFRLRGYLIKPRGGAPVAALAITPRPAGELAQNSQALAGARQVVGALGLAGALSASAAVWATRETTAGRKLVLQNQGRRRVEVNFHQAGPMTRFLNRLDRVGSHRWGRKVLASDGDLVQPSTGGVWHRGTSVVQTVGGPRTLTHLQSLRWPAHHLYFDRALSDEEVAGLVSSRAKAQRLPGYAGEIQPLESLAPAWSATKKALITTRLYHPSTEADWVVVPEETKT